MNLNESNLKTCIADENILVFAFYLLNVKQVLGISEFLCIRKMICTQPFEVNAFKTS